MSYGGEPLKIDIPYGARRIMEYLTRSGYKSYIVGGCVRDSLLYKEPHDWDICTDASPESVVNIFEANDFKVIKTGLQHGTVTIHWNDEDYEVTTLRTEGEYSDNRHPDSVRFVKDISADLARRDFTINAMAYNDKEGLVDPYGGVEDLYNGVIRCVGNPYERFTEDALRILRALRFASTYEFVIDPKTSEAIHRFKWRLRNISAERIRDELCKMLCGDSVIYELLRYNDVITEIIPELNACLGFDQNNPYHIYDVYHHIAHAVDEYEGNDISIKMALLLHDIGKPRCYTENERGGHFYGHPAVSRQIAEQILTRLKFDNKTKNEVLELVLYHDVEIKASKRVARRLLNMLGAERVKQLMEVGRADLLAQGRGDDTDRLLVLSEFGKIVEEIIAEQECFQIKDLAVDGHDICSLGIQGPTVGSVLRYLLDQVLDEVIENEHDALMEEAKRLLKIADKFCEIGCTSFRLTREQIEELIKNGKITSDKEEPNENYHSKD